METTLIYNDYYNESYIINDTTDLLQIIKINIIDKNNSYYIYYKLKHFEEKELFHSYSKSFTKEEIIGNMLNWLLYEMKKGHFKHYSVWIKKD